MKLGTETGSFVNHIQSVATRGQPLPMIGMGATLLGWSDRHPGTITEVFTVGKGVYVTVQEDNAKRTDKNGMSESQTYEFSPDPNGRISTFRFSDRVKVWQEVRKNKETGRWAKADGRGLRIGQRDKYHDFSF